MNVMTGTTTIDARISNVEFKYDAPIVFKKKLFYPTEYMDSTHNNRLKNICAAFIESGYATVVKKNIVGNYNMVNDYFYVYVEEKFYLQVNQKRNKKLIAHYEAEIKKATESLAIVKEKQIIVEAKLSWMGK